MLWTKPRLVFRYSQKFIICSYNRCFSDRIFFNMKPNGFGKDFSTSLFWLTYFTRLTPAKLQKIHPSVIWKRTQVVKIGAKIFSRLVVLVSSWSKLWQRNSRLAARPALNELSKCQFNKRIVKRAALLRLRTTSTSKKCTLMRFRHHEVSASLNAIYSVKHEVP